MKNHFPHPRDHLTGEQIQAQISNFIILLLINLAVNNNHDDEVYCNLNYIIMII